MNPKFEEAIRTAEKLLADAQEQVREKVDNLKASKGVFEKREALKVLAKARFWERSCADRLFHLQQFSLPFEPPSSRQKRPPLVQPKIHS
jgi:hypothetical protein